VGYFLTCLTTVSVHGIGLVEFIEVRFLAYMLSFIALLCIFVSFLTLTTSEIINRFLWIVVRGYVFFALRSFLYLPVKLWWLCNFWGGSHIYDPITFYGRSSELDLLQTFNKDPFGAALCILCTYFLFPSTQQLTGNISVWRGKYSCWKINLYCYQPKALQLKL